MAVRLYATETQFGGEMVDCIRIKAPGGKPAPKPQPKPEAAVPDFDPESDEVPF